MLKLFSALRSFVTEVFPATSNYQKHVVLGARVETESLKTETECLKTRIQSFETEIKTEGVKTETENIKTEIETETESINSESETESINSETETESINSETETESIKNENETENIKTETESIETETETENIKTETESIKTETETETENIKTETESIETKIETETKSIKSPQFVRVPVITEWVEDYVVGGYHPVHLGDIFKERYCILRKLGNGSYSTVWLAKDDTLGGYVALKVAMASDTTIREEVDTMTKLGFSPNPLATAYLPVPRLFDSFDLKGPNGVHNVIALELLGSSLADLIDEMEWNLGSDNEYRDISVLRELSRQIVDAVCYVHSKGIIHRDIHPGNIMFALKNPLKAIDEVDSDEDTTPQWSQETYPLLRVDGKPLDEHSPSYVVPPQPLENDEMDISLLSTSRLVLSDFGAATTFDNANGGDNAYPLAFRPPEALLGLPVTEKSDIWALGCTIFHLVNLCDLFCIDYFNKQDGDHLQSMIEVLGPLPERMLQLWRGRESHVDDSGNLLKEQVDDPFSDPLDVQLSDLMNKWLPSEEVSTFESFVRSIFQYEPEKRPSAEQLLRHPWLTSENASAKAA